MLVFQIFKIAPGVWNPDNFRDSYFQRSVLSEPIPQLCRSVWFITVEANYIAFGAI